MVTPAPTNAPEFTVSELAGAVKRTLEAGFERVRVRGELSRVSIPASGHLYTSLKDDGAVLDAVCWRTSLARLSVKPEEGLEVICTGRLTTYPARSNYQLVIEHIELAGIGAILKMIEDRRVRLAAEGLFEAAHKRSLPVCPQTIGVITSPTGAVIRDILHRLSDRFPVTVLLWPVAVQGERAAAEIAAAIHGFNALPGARDVQGGAPWRPDVLIVARGGGSIEDLMPFNDEAVVRAAAGSHIPLISAVGHETDTTLIDYAADVRAPTPTAAAEFAVPVRDALRLGLNESVQQLDRAAHRICRDGRAVVEALGARMGRADRLLALPMQKIDHLETGLKQALRNRFDQWSVWLTSLTGRIRRPSQLLNDQRHLLGLHGAALMRVHTRVGTEQAQRLDQAGRLLETLSFRRVLARGYAVVRDARGQVITHGAVLAPGQDINIIFGDQVEQGAVIKISKVVERN